MIKLREDSNAREMWDTCLKCTWLECKPDSKACPYNKKYGTKKGIALAPVLYQNTAGIAEDFDTERGRRRKGLRSKKSSDTIAPL